MALGRSSVGRPIYVASVVIVFAVFGASLTLRIGSHYESGHAAAVRVWLGAHLVLLVVVCSFFLFARFRFADVFIRHGVRILLAGLGAATLAFFAQSSLLMHI